MDTTVMTQDKIIEEVNEVLQIDIDAVGAYTSAINSCDNLEIKRQLTLFRSDHERHITDLKAIVIRCGGKPVDKPDVKGMLQRGFTKVAGLIGDESTLRAMLQNEKTTNDVYAKHVQKSFSPDILDVLRRNYADEQRHYSWIDNALKTRLWEAHPTP